MRTLFVLFVLVFLVLFVVLFMFVITVFVVLVVIAMVRRLLMPWRTTVRRPAMMRWRWWRRRSPLHCQRDVTSGSNVLEGSLDADGQQRRVAHVVGRVLAVGNVLHQAVRHAGHLGGAVLPHLGVVLFFVGHHDRRRGVGVGCWEDGGEGAEGSEREDAPRHDGRLVRGWDPGLGDRRLLRLLLILVSRHGDGGRGGGEERAQSDGLHDGLPAGRGAPMIFAI